MYKITQKKLSCGPDNTNNLHLINASDKLITVLTDLYNKTINENVIPHKLKQAIITMIPKK